MELFQSRPSSIELSMDPAFIGPEEGDIYRGHSIDNAIPTFEPRPISPGSSSSSSSSSSAASGRLGALALVVELAISRWARANSSSSSLSSSSSSSSDSISTRSRIPRRRRRPSVDDFNARSERDILARLKARQQTRQIPREFSLYVPPALPLPANMNNDRRFTEDTGIPRTHLLPALLARLNATLKACTKLRDLDRLNHPADTQPEPGPSRMGSLGDAQVLRQTLRGKRKTKEGRPAIFTGPIETPDTKQKNNRQAWWLDVSSPTGEDMRALGKLLHLHPLTLEDILSRDPREKLEIFPKLGYYFIVFKAIESAKTREGLHRLTHKEGQPISGANEGVIGEDLIYLVVLRGGEGLCTFHFTDISEHLDHVREKVLRMDETVKKSADWIAHGVLDSVVDSFFPFLTEIGDAVDRIEDVVYSGNVSEPEPEPELDEPILDSISVPDTLVTLDEKRTAFSDSLINEKLPASSVNSRQVKPRFRLPSATVPLYLRRTRRMLNRFWKRTSTHNAKSPLEPTSTTTVHRMARTRRLVTSLTRLLLTKADLVAQIKKRLHTRGELILGVDHELYIHLGDILDHILTLQQSLAHYERMLSQSHPSYLSQLHISATRTKSGSDKAIIFLTIISIGTLSIQTLIGLFSMNCTVPTNRRPNEQPGGPYNIFGLVIAIALVVLTIFLSFVKYTWIRAKRKRIARL